MTTRGSAPPTALGFLTILDTGDKGFVGGYLVLNAAGRPLEFHCTNPVKPNRAQEILYGPTLLPYLHGEQIAPALLAKAKTPPRLVCTDLAPALTARASSPAPVVLIATSDAESGAKPKPTLRIDGAHHDLNWLDLGPRRLALPAEHAADREEVAAICRELAEGFDLTEPFSRIREALKETFGGARS